MTAYRRAVFGLVLGLAAVAWPLLVWAWMVAESLRDPKAFHDQGGMFIAYFLFPLAMLGAAAAGVPAIRLTAARPGSWAVGPDPGWRPLGAALGVVGMLLAVGTCVGPRRSPGRLARQQLRPD